MGQTTEIAWTDHTFNPWWGCTRVSEGCRHCYAEGLSKRWGHDVWGPSAARRRFGDAHWAEPLKWARDAAREGMRRRVFCSSMADWLEDRRELDAERVRLGALVEATPGLDWQLLTKRPENLARLSPWAGREHSAHAWVGTTVEHDATRARLDHLCAYPAAVRFVSAEPLVGAVDLRPWLDRLHWVIVGGESGPGRRTMDLDAAERIVRDCMDAGVAVFVKQDSGARTGQQGRIPDAWFVREFPCHRPSKSAAA